MTTKKTKTGGKKTQKPSLSKVVSSSDSFMKSTPPPRAAVERREKPPEPVAKRETRIQVGSTKEIKPRPAVRASRGVICDAFYAEMLRRGLSVSEAMESAEVAADAMRLDGEQGDVPEAKMYDLRSEQDYSYPGGKRRVLKRGNSPVVRDPSAVTTLVIHQAAVEFGVSARLVRKSLGDAELARARRALDVACHAMAFRQGFFVMSHPLRDYVNHANRLNGESLGLEIDGRYPGLMDDPDTVAREDLKSTWGGNPTQLTEKTVEAACAAAKQLVEEGRADGMPLKYVRAHRQSSDTRRSDPGEEIWKRVVLGYIVPELGLTPLRDSRWREGRPIPTQWDPEGLGDY